MALRVSECALQEQYSLPMAFPFPATIFGTVQLAVLVAVCAQLCQRFPAAEPSRRGSKLQRLIDQERANVDSYDIRIDHRITDNNYFFARYSKSDTARSRDNFFPLGSFA